MSFRLFSIKYAYHSMHIRQIQFRQSECEIASMSINSKNKTPHWSRQYCDVDEFFIIRCTGGCRWQPPVQPVIKNSLTWWPSRFSVAISKYMFNVPVFCSIIFNYRKCKSAKKSNNRSQELNWLYRWLTLGLITLIIMNRTQQKWLHDIIS